MKMEILKIKQTFLVISVLGFGLFLQCSKDQKNNDDYLNALALSQLNTVSATGKTESTDSSETTDLAVNTTTTTTTEETTQTNSSNEKTVSFAKGYKYYWTFASVTVTVNEVITFTTTSSDVSNINFNLFPNNGLDLSIAYAYCFGEKASIIQCAPNTYLEVVTSQILPNFNLKVLKAGTYYYSFNGLNENDLSTINYNSSKGTTKDSIIYILYYGKTTYTLNPNQKLSYKFTGTYPHNISNYIEKTGFQTYTGSSISIIDLTINFGPYMVSLGNKWFGGSNSKYSITDNTVYTRFYN